MPSIEVSQNGSKESGGAKGVSVGLVGTCLVLAYSTYLVLASLALALLPSMLATCLVLVYFIQCIYCHSIQFNITFICLI